MWAMYRATDGECRWWGMPANPNDLTKGAIVVAVDRGWMLDRGDTVCLTDAGRELFKHGNHLAVADFGLWWTEEEG
jgi:hypothetical protein